MAGAGGSDRVKVKQPRQGRQANAGQASKCITSILAHDRNQDQRNDN